jgi:hypothetical protein
MRCPVGIWFPTWKEARSRVRPRQSGLPEAGKAAQQKSRARSDICFRRIVPVVILVIAKLLLEAPVKIVFK